MNSTKKNCWKTNRSNKETNREKGNNHIKTVTFKPSKSRKATGADKIE